VYGNKEGFIEWMSAYLKNSSISGIFVKMYKKAASYFSLDSS
jgi:hypothetical protein